jgi:peroxiredoxin
LSPTVLWQGAIVIRSILAACVVMATAAFASAQTTAPSTRPSTVGQVASSAAEVSPLGIGEHLPTLSLKTAEGSPFDLNAAVAKQPTVLIFYRGGWCPFCNRQMSGLQGIVGELTKSGYQLLAISPDKPAELRKSAEKHALTYTLLSDSDATAIRAFGLAFKVDDATIARMATMHVDLEKASGETHHLLPVPAVYIVGTDGVIRFVHYDPNFRNRMQPDKILEEAKTALPH